jgi:ABC-2 type transport system ATP-binding protein
MRERREQMNILEVEHLAKYFKAVKAVDDISFAVKKGEIFGLLGPNGAGKSTTIKMLVTILKASSGSARIAGFDVNRDSRRVRESVGIIFQDPSLDERLTARENLYFHARLYHIPQREIRARIEAALALVGLTDRAGNIVVEFSGGMKRRLEIARGILHTPTMLFLDEPTIGLDPQTRSYIWSYLSGLRTKQKLSMLLTTHYMEEAEICDRVAIIDNGKIIALDTPENLKASLKGDTITLTSENNSALARDIEQQFKIKARKQDGAISLVVENGSLFIPKLFKAFPNRIVSIELKKPSLEDVFIDLTGRTIREEESSATDRLRTSVRRRKRT